jgi:serine/threonine protein kinase
MTAKVYAPDPAHQRYQAKIDYLRKEILLIRQLDHPCVVRYCTTALNRSEGEIYVILEHVDGQSLKERIVAGQGITETATVAYIRKILSGLAYLHRSGVIHRDLKSANILVTHDGATVKITDFGSARHFSTAQERAHGLTRSLKGSPYWMAPEITMR